MVRYNSSSMKSSALILCFFVSVPILPCVAQSTQNLPESVGQLERDIKQHPDSAKLYVSLGEAFLDRSDYSHAIDALRHAVKLNPASAEAHNWLGVAMSQNGDFPA